MITLVLDCAYKPVVAILKDGKELLTLTNENEKHSDFFMKQIDECLNKLYLKISDVNQIMINVGPGSFTGLRVAVSIAKGLGFSGEIKFIKFTSFDYLKTKKEILLEGFSSFVYKKNQRQEMSCEDIKELDKEVDYVTISHPLYENLRGLEFKIQQLDKLSYEEIYENVSKKELLISEIEPLYLRKSQAEIEREKRK